MFETIHNNLLEWYETNGRHDLPWRNTDDPYRIWVSEIMLQQTQVKTVLKRFYFPFLQAFPTLADLAAADPDDVLKKWEGLGYYTRAKNLHRAARMCSPFLPKSVEALHRLPGIGMSTAHAVAAFAYRTPVPILDANVKRILYRFFGRRNADEKTLWKLAERLFDPQHPFEYNQAMMDIGAMVCLPKTPLCETCPLSSGCKGAAADPLRYPAPKARAKTPVRQRHIIVYVLDDRLGLYRRRTRFLHGLWGFFEQDDAPQPEASNLGRVTQIYSHFRLEADVWVCEHHHPDLTYFYTHELETLALSRADHKVIKLLRDRRLLEEHRSS